LDRKSAITACEKVLEKNCGWLGNYLSLSWTFRKTCSDFFIYVPLRHYSSFNASHYNVLLICDKVYIMVPLYILPAIKRIKGIKCSAFLVTLTSLHQNWFQGVVWRKFSYDLKVLNSDDRFNECCWHPLQSSDAIGLLLISGTIILVDICQHLGEDYCFHFNCQIIGWSIHTSMKNAVFWNVTPCGSCNSISSQHAENCHI
jgi:hypothetical protein